jgi:hypothetical protein
MTDDEAFEAEADRVEAAIARLAGAPYEVAGACLRGMRSEDQSNRPAGNGLAVDDQVREQANGRRILHEPAD